MVNKVGELTVYWGAMFTGKSTHLMIELITYGKKAICFKPSFDTRDNKEVIETHDGKRFPVVSVDQASEIFLHIGDHTAVGIDEAMLFGADPTLIPTVLQLRDLGLDVYVTGLDVDRHGKPYPQMMILASLADNCIKLRTLCSCGNKASISYYKGDGSSIIGRDDLYEPVCRTCFLQRKPSL